MLSSVILQGPILTVLGSFRIIGFWDDRILNAFGVLGMLDLHVCSV